MYIGIAIIITNKSNDEFLQGALLSPFSGLTQNLENSFFPVMSQCIILFLFL